MIFQSSQARHHELAATSFQATGHVEAVIKEPALATGHEVGCRRLLQRRHVALCGGISPGSWRDDACIILVRKALVIQDNLKVEKYRKRLEHALTICRCMLLPLPSWGRDARISEAHGALILTAVNVPSRHSDCGFVETRPPSTEITGTSRNTRSNTRTTRLSAHTPRHQQQKALSPTTNVQSIRSYTRCKPQAPECPEQRPGRWHSGGSHSSQTSEQRALGAARIWGLAKLLNMLRVALLPAAPDSPCFSSARAAWVGLSCMQNKAPRSHSRAATIPSCCGPQVLPAWPAEPEAGESATALHLPPNFPGPTAC